MSGPRQNAAAGAAAAAAFAVVAALVVTGALTAVDQYAADHWTAHLQVVRGSSSALGSIRLYPRLGNTVQVFCNLWTYPASPLCSSLLLLGGCGVLYRRGRRAAAVAWPLAWVLANAVELLGKSVLARPVLHLGGAPLHAFDSSFPSGHTVRAVLLVALLATLWRRAAVVALPWLVVTLPALVVNGGHTPTDVLGGVLLAAAAAFAVRAWLARAAPARLAYATATLR